MVTVAWGPPREYCIPVNKGIQTSEYSSSFRTMGVIYNLGGGGGGGGGGGKGMQLV